MRARMTMVAATVLVGLLACSDGAAPSGGGDREAAMFDGIADSIAASGDGWRAEALRHAAELVRLTGEPTPVTLSVDGVSRTFHAVAEELDVPLMVCHWTADSGVVQPDSSRTPPDSMSAPPGGSGGGSAGSSSCEPEGSYRMRTLIAWEPEHMAEVVRLVADQGIGRVQPTVPDPMVGPGYGGAPAGDNPTVPGDSIVTSPPGNPGPGFMGEYLVRDEGIWWSVDGTQENALEREGGECTRPTAIFDWAEFSCEATRVRFQFTMTVQRFSVVPMEGWNPRDSVPPAPAPESKVITMEPASVAGARLTVLRWMMPPVPVDPVPMPPVPVDSMPIPPVPMPMPPVPMPPHG